MGLPHSVADLALLNRMQQWAVRQLTAYSIRSYLRFKDDILVSIGVSALGGSFCRELMARSGYFRLQLEGLPADEVEWLDLSIFRHGGRIGTRPRFKPTTLAIPLGRDSAHPAHTHKAWPAARLMYMHSLCSDPRFFSAMLR